MRDRLFRKEEKSVTKKIFIIGIGAGNPDYLTIQAINAMNRADVFFVMDKGLAKEKLVQFRKDVIDRYVKGSAHRLVEAVGPERRRDDGDYPAAVDALNRDKQAVFEGLIEDELRDGDCGAFLVWGDPSLYDSTIRIIEAIAISGRHMLDYEVIPGISSVQALAARHRVPLNRIGRSIEITNGRGLAQGFPNNVDSVVVMLDAHSAYKTLLDQDIEIYWGAYVGTPDEILVSGKLRDVVGDIERLRDQARQTHGWVMDTYLLIKPGSKGCVSP